MIRYSGFTPLNADFARGTNTAIVNNLEAALVLAGWSVVSGSGTGDVVVKSAETPAGHYAVLRLRNNGGNGCARIHLRNLSGSIESTGHAPLISGVSNYHIFANPYQFFVFTLGASAGREMVSAGAPWIPDWLKTAIPAGALAWLSANAQSDNLDWGMMGSFRTLLTGSGHGSTYQATRALCNSVLMENTNGSAFGLVTPAPAAANEPTNGYRWHDDSVLVSDPLIAWPDTTSGESKIRGQLWDTVVVSESYADATTITLDSKSWQNITYSNTGSNSRHRGTLFHLLP